MHKADNLNHHPVPLSRNLGTLTFWNPLGHSRPVTGLLYLLIYVHLLVCYLNKLQTARCNDKDYCGRSQKFQELFFCNVHCSMHTPLVKNQQSVQIKRLILRSQKNAINSTLREYLWLSEGGHLLRLHSARRQKVW